MDNYKRITENKRRLAMREGCEKDTVPIQTFFAAYNRLAELEDKIEDGTITELPCKVGDTIFTCSFVCADGYEILENGTENMIHDCGWKVIPTFIKDKIGLFKACIAVEKGLAYATNAEAEAKLKELEVQNNG